MTSHVFVRIHHSALPPFCFTTLKVWLLQEFVKFPIVLWSVTDTV